MYHVGRIAHAGAAIFMLFVLTPNSAAYGQQAAGSPQSAPSASEPVKIDPEALKVPPPASPYDSSKFDLGKPELAIPKGIDLGKSQLEFDAKHTTDITKPGLTIDSGETSNLSKVLPGQKQEPVLPDYFGLKLRTPMR